MYRKHFGLRLRRCVGIKVLGGVVPANEAVGVGVHGFKLFCICVP